jgi:hypothetical protein
MTARKTPAKPLRKPAKPFVAPRCTCTHDDDTWSATFGFHYSECPWAQAYPERATGQSLRDAQTHRKTPAKPQDGKTRATAWGTRKTPAKPLTFAAIETWLALHAPPNPPDEPKPLTFEDIGAWHALKHAPAPEPSWDATGLIAALMLAACLALGGVVEAFAHAHGVLGL